MTPAAADDKGSLGITHLKRFWSKALLRRSGLLGHDTFPEEWPQEMYLLSTLKLGLEPTIQFLFQQEPSFEAFEAWILAQNGGRLEEADIQNFNEGVPPTSSEPDALCTKDLDQWEENGYVIVKQAVPKADCEAAIEAICANIEIDRNDPKTWYRGHDSRKGIMVQLFQHPALNKNRNAPKIKRAFQQLWGRQDLLVNMDRAGFNPPEKEDWRFPGPHLHWDVSLELPIPFGTQGILYLSDTAPEQGALQLIPGFQHRIQNWIESLPEKANPRTQDLKALGPIRVGANAGDFIIWHQALPHGSSPNTTSLPRIVQYINYQPRVVEIQKEWK
jgi:ectoine hydroxylase-related dioxygenase (phytanoyl-CoA dioxygenase family)